jgi:hypothetical protein
MHDQLRIVHRLHAAALLLGAVIIGNESLWLSLMIGFCAAAAAAAVTAAAAAGMWAPGAAVDVC